MSIWSEDRYDIPRYGPLEAAAEAAWDQPSAADLAADASDDERRRRAHDFDGLLRPEDTGEGTTDEWLREALKVQCAGCGFEFNTACEVCHPF